VPGEGSVFLLVSHGDTHGKYCEVGSVAFKDEAGDEDPDLYILDADGMSADERAYREIARRDVMIAGYSPLFGSMMTGSAFHCATAALTLRNQIRYACPIQDNPHGTELCAVTEQTRIGRIQCIKYGCLQEKAAIELKR
jgi:hypothetical protein